MSLSRHAEMGEGYSQPWYWCVYCMAHSWLSSTWLKILNCYEGEKNIFNMLFPSPIHKKSTNPRYMHPVGHPFPYVWALTPLSGICLCVGSMKYVSFWKFDKWKKCRILTSSVNVKKGEFSGVCVNFIVRTGSVICYQTICVWITELLCMEFKKNNVNGVK